ncbi:MAG: hypothetical protein IT361_00340 [Gemmatimonadaceae bacterium]|nr:hypothetical protein [Gemmatimonadaceae bacterium]
MRFRHAAVLALVAVVTIVAGCADAAVDPQAPLTPTARDTSLLVNSLSPAPGAPAIANPVVAFYAKAGDSRQAFMYYRSRPGRSDSTVFIRFRVSKGSLLSRPNGTPFVDGDSILITMTLIDPARLIVRFEPSGLRFAPLDPADIKFNFRETNDDRNGDGVVDGTDATYTSLLSIWKRENVSAPWLKQSSVLAPALHEIEADVTGFTDYIIAW